MLYLIGIGLWDENDITLKGLDILKECKDVYIETYTNKWQGNLNDLDGMIGKPVKTLERSEVESEFLSDEAKTKDIALLISGDPLAATTHVQLIKDCKKKNVKVKIVHNSSILTAVGECGLSLYKFGRTTTLVRPTENYNPKSPYKIIKKNKENDLHTLILLDIGEKPMTVNEGVKFLKDMDEDGIVDTLIAGVKLGSDDSKIVYNHYKNIDMDKYPGFLVVPGKIDENEKEAIKCLLKKN